MGIGVVIGTEGFRPVGGGFRSSDSPETLCIVAKVGFVDFTGGFRGLFANGDGVRFRKDHVGGGGHPIAAAGRDIAHGDDDGGVGYYPNIIIKRT